MGTKPVMKEHNMDYLLVLQFGYMFIDSQRSKSILFLYDTLY